MPPRRRTRPAPPDVDALRAALEAGKIVRVGIIPSDQFPEGITGRVRRIGNPAQDGDEYLFVEVSVGGAKDVLPFAPGDLTGSPPRKPATVAAGGPAVASGSRTGRPTSPAGPVALFAAATSAPTSQTPPAVPTPGATARTSTGSDAAAPTRTPPTGTADRERAADRNGAQPGVGQPGDAGAPVSRRTTGAAARGKRPPVTITISTSGDEAASWRVEARIGSRTAVRPTPVPPSRVWEIVESLGEPKLTAVVQTLLDEHRRSTQARADALAAQLAALQDELSSYPSADG